MAAFMTMLTEDEQSLLAERLANGANFLDVGEAEEWLVKIADGLRFSVDYGGRFPQPCLR
jgi:hypothetical protein